MLLFLSFISIQSPCHPQAFAPPFFKGDKVTLTFQVLFFLGINSNSFEKFRLRTNLRRKEEFNPQLTLVSEELKFSDNDEVVMQCEFFIEFLFFNHQRIIKHISNQLSPTRSKVCIITSCQSGFCIYPRRH